MDYENQIICGDHLDVFSKFQNECIDLTVTSPPYDNLRDYKGYKFNFKALAKELFRITKIGGVIVWVVSDATVNGSETGTSFKQALYFKEIGFNLHDTMIWQKPGFSATGSLSVRYASVFEYMFILVKRKIKTFNALKDRKVKCPNNILKGTVRLSDGSMKRMSNEGKIYGINGFGQRYNIWMITPQSQYDKHPAPFPEQLARDHILSWSNEGDIVLDPMCGSGTTLIEAKKLNRKYIGIDVSKEYCELSEKRVIIDREHFEVCDNAETLNSSDFSDLLV